jgi:hypothetical protein
MLRNSPTGWAAFRLFGQNPAPRLRLSISSQICRYDNFSVRAAARNRAGSRDLLQNGDLARADPASGCLIDPHAEPVARAGCIEELTRTLWHDSQQTTAKVN